MESTINQRIEELAKSSLVRSKRALATSCGIAQSTLESIIKGSEPRYNAIYRLLSTYPSISPDWLLLGRGDMYRHPETSVNINKTTGNGNVVGNTNSSIVNGYSEELERLREENKVLRQRCDRLTDKLLNSI